ncbi:MAG: hypothetical protein C0391_01600 [Anaerolinea sp.]|nr:hypothetical protein [Anaerolinea sp.]
MNYDSLVLLLKILAFAGIVSLIYYYFRKKKSSSAKTNTELDAKIAELRSQGLTEEAAQQQAVAEYRNTMLAKQKKVSLIMGVVWMAFGAVFYMQSGRLDMSSIALLGLGAVQLLTGLLIKPRN